MILNSMKGVGKNLTGLKLESPLLHSKMRLEQQIDDRPRKVTDYHFCRSKPKPRKSPHLAGLSKQAARLLDLDPQAVLQDPDTPLYLSGSKLLPDSDPLCNNYCGYQFGVWAGQLGDGRAHTLGCLRNANKQLWEVQLKGSGVTPFSRMGDGNSVVSSALREFLCSEALAGLRVPTTRALSLVVADEPVKRDPLYNGVVKVENAAVVVRLAPSFLRFGSFEVCNEYGQCRKEDALANREFIKALADSLIREHYPHLLDEQLGDPYEQLYRELADRSARLVAKWQSLGFVHGVLNTDNMSMLGLTIDYGPFSFIDYFSKDFVSNATDTHERYSYRQQPTIVKWNLSRLAEAFDVLVPRSILAKHLEKNYDTTYRKEYYRLMKDKLGLDQKEQCEPLIDELLEILHEFSCNFTNVFRVLSESLSERGAVLARLVEEAYPAELHRQNLRVFPQLLKIPQETLQKVMEGDEGFNKYVVVEQPSRIAKARQLSTLSKEQYEELQRSVWSKWLDKYCPLKRDQALQDRTNPRYVLRNDIGSKLLTHLTSLAQNSQPGFLERVLDVLGNPTHPSAWFSESFWAGRCSPLKLTCSS